MEGTTPGILAVTGAPRTEARAQAEPGPKVKSSEVSFMLPAQPKHSDPGAPAACTTAGNGFNTVFSAPCQGCHSLQELRKSLFVLRKSCSILQAWLQKTGSPKRRQSLPVANFSSELIFPGAGGQGCKTECWGQPG